MFWNSSSCLFNNNKLRISAYPPTVISYSFCFLKIFHSLITLAILWPLRTHYHLSIRLSALANKIVGHLVKFEFQISNTHIFSISTFYANIQDIQY